MEFFGRVIVRCASTLPPLRGRVPAEQAGEGPTSPDMALPSPDPLRGPPSPARGGGRTRVIVAIVSLTVCIAVPATYTRADDGEKTVLGGLLSKALSTPGSQVSIGAVDGALSSNATIRDVVISDRNGPWLKLDKARLVWSRLALLSGRLQVDSLEIGRLEVLRRPLPAPVSATPEPDGSLLPELPVKVEITAFKLAELVLGETVAGQPARLSAEGKAKLGAPSEGLDLDLSVRRLDATGQFVARLLFVPKGEKLEVKTTLVEAAGGLLSKFANLPGEPPINLDLDGRGTLDAWNARLDFDAGPDLGAKGTARIARAGADRSLTLDLSSRIEGLLPGPAAAIFSGTTKLDGALRFADNGAFGIDRLALASRTARLDASGGLTPERVADFTISARAVPTDGSVTKAANAELDTLVFDGTVKGPIARPRVNGDLKAAGLRADGNVLERIAASLAMEPTGGDPNATRFALRADANVEGLKLADPALRRAVGSRGAFTFRGTLQPDGVVDVAAFDLDAPTATLSYAGRVGQNTLTGTLKAGLADLSAFSDVADRTLAGSVAVKANLSGDPARKAVTADVDATTQGLVLGLPALDRLLGREPHFSGRLSQVFDGYSFDGVKLDGAEMVARLEGKATARLADAKLLVDVKTLSALDPRLAGRALLDGRLSGTLEKPDLTATLTAADGRALGRPIRDVRVAAALKDLTGALDGTVALGGEIGGKTLRGDVHLARSGADWSLDRLAVNLGSATLAGKAAVDAATLLAQGSVTLSAANLDDLSPLALTPMAGSLDATVALSREGGRQDASVKAKGASLRSGEIGLAQLDADLTGRDLLAHPVVDGRVNADRVIAAGESIDTVRLLAVGSPNASDITLTAKARGFDLDGAARLVPAEATRIELSRFSASRGKDRLALAGPATITLDRGSAVIDGLVIAAGTGRVSLAGRARIESRPETRHPGAAVGSCPHCLAEPRPHRHPRRGRRYPRHGRAAGRALCPVGGEGRDIGDAQGRPAAHRRQGEWHTGRRPRRDRGPGLGRSRRRADPCRLPARLGGRTHRAEAARHPRRGHGQQPAQRRRSAGRRPDRPRRGRLGHPRRAPCRGCRHPLRRQLHRSAPGHRPQADRGPRHRAGRYPRGGAPDSADPERRRPSGQRARGPGPEWRVPRRVSRSPPSGPSSSPAPSSPPLRASTSP